MSLIQKNIIYEDGSIVVIDKPSGILSIPDGYHPEYQNLKDELDIIYGRVWTVHRLDKGTSGVIIFALTKSVHRDLNIQFTNHFIQKEYFAISHTIPDWEKHELEIKIKINGDRKHRTTVSNIGKFSKSVFILMNQNSSSNISKIKIFPQTGYTHQIRCHLSYLGLPIVGDALYSNNLSIHQNFLNEKFGRMMLHSNLIRFKHPLTGKPLELRAPPPNLFDIN